MKRPAYLQTPAAVFATWIVNLLVAAAYQPDVFTSTKHELSKTVYELLKQVYQQACNEAAV